MLVIEELSSFSVEILEEITLCIIYGKDIEFEEGILNELFKNSGLTNNLNMNIEKLLLEILRLRSKYIYADRILYNGHGICFIKGEKNDSCSRVT